MTEESKIMSMEEASKAIEKEDKMTETDKALAELPTFEEAKLEDAKRKYAKEKEFSLEELTKRANLNLQENQNKTRKTETEKALDETREILRKSIDETDDFATKQKLSPEFSDEKKEEDENSEFATGLKLSPEFDDVEDEDKPKFIPTVQQPIENTARNEYLAAAKQAQQTIEEQPQPTKEWGYFVKENKAQPEEQAVQSGEGELKDSPEMKDEEKIILSSDLQQEIQESEDEENKSEINKEKLSDMLKEEIIEQPVGRKIDSEWQNLEQELDKASTTEELELLPEITELEPLPIRGIGEIIKDTPMDEDTKEWLQSKRGLLTKINNTEGSEKQKRELLFQDLQAELEEKQLELKRKWFFGKSELKKDIARLNEIINNSDLFKQGKAKLPLKPRSGIGSGNNAGFARKV